MRMIVPIVLAFYLSVNTVNLFAQCEEMEKNVQREKLGEPVLEGKPTLIPEIKLKVTKRDTSEIMPLQMVRLFYAWKHFEDHHGGQWDETYDLIDCTTDTDGIVYFTEYNFVPRGWYDGPKIKGLLWGKNLPALDYLEVRVENTSHFITKDQIKMIRDNKIIQPIELKLPGGYVAPVKVEIVPLSFTSDGTRYDGDIDLYENPVLHFLGVVIPNQIAGGIKKVFRVCL